jgi:putative ABC transport system substrate-binding protein
VPIVASFEKGLAARGHIKDSTTTIEYVFRPGPRQHLQEAAQALSERVNVLVAWGTIVAVAAQEAKVSCPVVFSSVGFPVAIGMVSSLRRPGGNFTGISFEGAEDTYGKRLQILKEIVPHATRVAALGHADDTNIVPALETAHRVAPSLGIDVVDVTVRSVADLEPAFAAMSKRRIQGVLVIAGAFMFVNRDPVARLAIAHHLPTVHGLREGVVSGGLVSLGPDLVVMAEQAAGYVDRILRGARAADLPVEQPTRYELYVNLRTAKALGLIIPPSLLLRADQVID